MVGARIVRGPLNGVARTLELRQRVIKEGLAVRAQNDGAARGKQLAVVEQVFHGGEALRCLAFAGVRRGEVERDAGELTGGEHVRKLFAAAGDEQRVLDARFDHALGGVGDADRLHVDAYEKDVRLCLRGGYQVAAFAAAKVESHLAERPRRGAIRMRIERPARLRPVASVGCGNVLDGVAIALQALVQDKVLGGSGAGRAH